MLTLVCKITVVIVGRTVTCSIVQMPLGATMSTTDKTPTASTGDRRQGTDRRKAQLPFEGPDRRKGDRRSGKDRRSNPRVYSR